MVGPPAEYTLHVSSNKVFVPADVDCILDQSKLLCHTWGKYHTCSEVATATKKKASSMPLEVTSADYVAYWSGHSTWPAFKTSPVPCPSLLTTWSRMGRRTSRSFATR